MTVTVAQLAQTMQTVLTTVADQAAHDTGFVRRRRQLTGATFTQALVFGWLDNPDATLEDLAQAAATVGAPVSAQALDQRFTPPAAECLRTVWLRAVQQVLHAQPLALPLLQRFAGVYLLDSTVIGLPACLAELWPGCGGSTAGSGRAALKVQVRWELTTGAFDGLTLQSGRHSDAHAELTQAPLPPGSLRLADLGYFDLDGLQRYDQQGVYWLTRLKWGTALRVNGERIGDLVGWLARPKSARIDQAVQVGSRQRLTCRLLAVCVPPAVAEQRRRRLRKDAQAKGYRVQPGRLAACAWNLWITNVPASQLSLEEAEVLARVRWQIELLFKLWKSQGGVGRSRSDKGYRVLCEVYGKLLAMVVQHWVALVSWGRSVDRSMRKTARKVRQHAMHLASVLGSVRQLRQALRLLQRCLQKGLRVNKRRRKPATFQILLEPKRAA